MALTLGVQRINSSHFVHIPDGFQHAGRRQGHEAEGPPCIFFYSSLFCLADLYLTHMRKTREQ